MSDSIEFLIRQLPALLVGFPGQRPGGLILSVLLAGLAVGMGFLIAIVIGSGQESRFGGIRFFCRVYVEVFRGLPLILLVILVYQVLGGRRFGLDLSPGSAALISLTLYSGAYQAEIVRAGLRAVPNQLIDTARVMGSTPWQVFRRVTLGYAVRVMLPALAGQAISLFKDTSVVVIIGVAELMTTTRMVLGSELRNTAYWVILYLFVGLLYFSIAFALSRFAQRWEQRTRPRDLVHSLANYG